MVLFYFSGTGNSKFAAKTFCVLAGADCRSVEEKTDFDALIGAHDTIGFCYPVYGSYVPRPMREFVAAHADALAGKRFVILCTQLIFSGDGARELCAFLP
ncbi:MAG: flavodoxin domain-containing protein, partial [Eubacteriales bacterium]